MRHCECFIIRLAANANPRIVATYDQWRGRAIELPGKRLMEVTSRLLRRISCMMPEQRWAALFAAAAPTILTLFCCRDGCRKVTWIPRGCLHACSLFFPLWPDADRWIPAYMGHPITH